MEQFTYGGDESADVLEFLNDVLGEGFGVFALSLIVVDAVCLFFFEESLDRLGVRDVNVTDLKTTVRTLSIEPMVRATSLRVEAASGQARVILVEMVV